ncbi:MAG: Ig domain-containing protein, partial [Myxococcota bacterium]
LVGAAACGDPPQGTEGDAAANEPDATFPADSDSGAADLGISDEDAGTADASPDAGRPDAGSGDAGFDAGPRDGGAERAGYTILEGLTNYYDDEVSCQAVGGGVRFDDDGLHDTTLPFAFSAFGVTYPAGARVAVSRDGAFVIGASPGAPSFDLQAPPPTGALIVPHGSEYDLRTGSVEVIRSAESFEIFYCSMVRLGSGGDAFVNVRVRLRAGNQRIVVQVLGGADNSAAAGIADANHRVELGCSPTCDFDPFTVYVLTPTDIPQVGHDLTWVSASGLPSVVAPGTSFAEPSYVVENSGNAASSGAITRPYVVSVAEGLQGVGPSFGSVVTYDGGSAPGVASGQSTSVPSSRSLVAPRTPGFYRFVVWLEQRPLDLDPTNDTFDVGTFEVRASPPCQIQTSSLPVGSAGQAYSAQLTASGCPSPTWTVSPSLPAGLSLSPAGSLSGVPAASSAGQYRFTAAQAGYASGTSTINLVVN